MTSFCLNSWPLNSCPLKVPLALLHPAIMFPFSFLLSPLFHIFTSLLKTSAPIYSQMNCCSEQFQALLYIIDGGNSQTQIISLDLEFHFSDLMSPKIKLLVFTNPQMNHVSTTAFPIQVDDRSISLVASELIWNPLFLLHFKYYAETNSVKFIFKRFRIWLFFIYLPSLSHHHLSPRLLQSLTKWSPNF